MHHLPSRYAVTRFRSAAALLLLKWVLVVSSAVCLGCSALVANRDLAHLAIGLIGLVVPVTLVQWLTATRARCPLCIGHPLAHRACATHHGTRRLFGSYRLRVAVAVLFRGSFRCPYCGEPTVIEVRRRD